MDREEIINSRGYKIVYAAAEAYQDVLQEGNGDTFMEGFEVGAQWADNFPQDNLVDINSVCNWLKDNLPKWVDSYKEDKIVEDLRKAFKKQ